MGTGRVANDVIWSTTFRPGGKGEGESLRDGLWGPGVRVRVREGAKGDWPPP